MRGSRSSASYRTSTKLDARARLRQESRVVALATTLLGMAVLGYCYPRGLLLLYGDAVAHMHIARRVFDSLNPGFRQLGSVWLPLPHILLLPFVQRMDWWQSGLGGAWPSIACYIAGSVGVYRLARIWLAPQFATVAVAFYALNPGLLYMQTTAMNEPLFLAEVIWSVLLVVECGRALENHDQRRACRSLVAAGLVVMAAVYTRYDGWVFGFLIWLAVAWRMLREKRWKEPVGGAFTLFTVMVAVAPALWLAYNAKQFHDPLDFIRGPYSAKAIEDRTRTPGAPRYPGWHSMRVAALYFLKAAELGAAPLRFANTLFWLAVAGTAAAVAGFRTRGIGPALLLWLPLPFYAYSVAYGSVPIFIPLWWPHSWYNTRYGMELLPAFALFLGFLVAWLSALADRKKQHTGLAVVAIAALLIVADYAMLVRAKPIVFQEAEANSATRIPFESALSRALKELPRARRILMYTSEHIGALQQAGIPLKQTINEGDYYQWPGALANPAGAAPWVVAIDGDAVSQAIKAHPQGLEIQDVICSTGQPCARIYHSSVVPDTSVDLAH
jgi:hypothetical protein